MLKTKSLNKSPWALLMIVLLLFVNSCCNECNVEECRISLKGIPITVSDNVSGGQGTHITPDSVYNVQTNSALVNLKIKKIGRCHEVLGYGHTWSSFNPEPIIELNEYVDYGHIDKGTFTNEFILTSLLTNLEPKTQYYVRSWIAVDVTKQDCSVQRIVYYNTEIKTFKTL